MVRQTTTVIPPTLLDAMLTLKADIFKTLNCMKIGTIQNFDKTKKTASIQILFKRVLPNGDAASYPALVDCPVFTLQGGGAALQFPIAAGDQCLVFFADRNIDAWYKTGSEQIPFDGRVHDISDGVALVGVNALTSPLPDYADDEAFIKYQEAKFGMKSGKITLKNNIQTLLTAIEGLIDVIKAVSTVPGGGPLNAASIAALEAYKTTFEAFLY